MSRENGENPPTGGQAGEYQGLLSVADEAVVVKNQL
jgi:hypothetical protein